MFSALPCCPDGELYIVTQPPQYWGVRGTGVAFSVLHLSGCHPFLVKDLLIPKTLAPKESCHSFSPLFQLEDVQISRLKLLLMLPTVVPLGASGRPVPLPHVIYNSIILGSPLLFELCKVLRHVP